jgi:hypothetical protein
MPGSKGTAGEGGIGAVGGDGAGRGEGGLVTEGGLLSLVSSAAKAGKEHRHHSPIETGIALESIEASEFFFVATSKDNEHNSLAICFI